MQKPQGLIIAGIIMLGISANSIAEEAVSAEKMNEITAYCKAESAGALTPEAFIEECIDDQLHALKEVKEEKEKS